MSVHFAEIVDWHALRDAVVGALVSGIGITMAYGLLILGGVRASEHYRDRHMTHAVAYGLLGLIGLAVTVAGVIFGLIVVAD